jgi:hypothetical protein
MSVHNCTQNYAHIQASCQFPLSTCVDSFLELGCSHTFLRLGFYRRHLLCDDRQSQQQGRQDEQCGPLQVLTLSQFQLHSPSPRLMRGRYFSTMLVSASLDTPASSTSGTGGPDLRTHRCAPSERASDRRGDSPTNGRKLTHAPP